MREIPLSFPGKRGALCPSRPAENSFMTEIRPPGGALQILGKLRDSGHRALLAGGCVRDHLMGLTPEDWDIATGAGPEEIMGLFERTVSVGAKFGVVRVMVGDASFEVAQFRSEGPYLDGRRPSSVKPANEKEDAQRRDFTINGIFFDPVANELLDYVGGREDIEDRLIRAIGDPLGRFGEDHLRMLRAVRFAARFGYEIELETLAAIYRCAPQISHTSAERKYGELTAMLTGGRADRAFEMLRETGLLAEVLPEVAKMEGVAQPPDEHPEGDVWKHTIKALAQLNAPAPVLAWAVLLHDAGKPETFSETDRIRFINHAEAGTRIAEEICERLNMPGEEKRLIRDVVKSHMKFLDVEKMRESTLKRFLREPFFAELLELHRIDRLASHGDLTAHRFCLDKQAEFGEEALRPDRVLDGHTLARMGFAPGPLFQEILAALDDEQLEGRVRSREEAEAFVRRRFGARLGPEEGGRPD